MEDICWHDQHIPCVWVTVFPWLTFVSTVTSRGGGAIVVFVKGWESNSKALWELKSTFLLSYILVFVCSSHLPPFCLYICIYVWAICMGNNVSWRTCGNQRAPGVDFHCLGSGIKLRLLGLATSPFTLWSIPLAPRPLCFFETGSSSITQTGLELTVQLRLASHCSPPRPVIFM